MFAFIMIFRKLRHNNRKTKKCWNCRFYSPVGNKFGVCDRIKSVINYRDFREEDISTEANNAKENGWRVSHVSVLGYMVCDLYQPLVLMR